MRGTDACWSVHIYAVAGSESLRDVIAFPKSASGKELMSGAPAAATDEQLEELLETHLKPRVMWRDGVRDEKRHRGHEILPRRTHAHTQFVGHCQVVAHHGTGEFELRR